MNQARMLVDYKVRIEESVTMKTYVHDDRDLPPVLAQIWPDG
jgi:hypothetical protein